MLYGRLPTTRRSPPSVAKSNVSASASCSASCSGEKRVAQPRSEIAVDLDRRDVSCALDQRAGQRAEARSDLDDVVAGLRRDRVDDARDVVRIGEEILPEALARLMTLHRMRVIGRRRERHGPLSRRELDREIDGRDEASDIGRRARARVDGEIERGAVVDRRADERQAERHVDAVAEARGFQHRQALVVVHRDDRVEALRDVGHEHRVGGKRAGRRRAPRARAPRAPAR